MFAGAHPRKNPLRTFGGQLMAQAFVAASRTLVHDIAPSALSVHFIAGGDPAADIEFHVVRLRDERRFANRRVDAMQNGKLLATALVSYLSAGSGLEHNVAMPDLPAPETLPTIDELLVGYEKVVPGFVEALRPIEWRYTNDPAWIMREKGGMLTANQVWLKADGVMPDDPMLHTAAMVYSSDTTVLDSIITTHGLSWGWDRIFAVTVNHSVWFHRQVDFSDWVLYSTSSPVAAESRGLGTGPLLQPGRGRGGHRRPGRNRQALPREMPDSGRIVWQVTEPPVQVALRLRARERVVVHVDTLAARWVGALALLIAASWLAVLVVRTHHHANWHADGRLAWSLTILAAVALIARGIFLGRPVTAAHAIAAAAAVWPASPPTCWPSTSRATS